MQGITLLATAPLGWALQLAKGAVSYPFVLLCRKAPFVSGICERVSDVTSYARQAARQVAQFAQGEAVVDEPVNYFAAYVCLLFTFCWIPAIFLVACVSALVWCVPVGLFILYRLAKEFLGYSAPPVLRGPNFYDPIPKCYDSAMHQHLAVPIADWVDIDAESVDEEVVQHLRCRASTAAPTGLGCAPANVSERRPS